MGLKETIAGINNDTGLGFMKDRVKRNCQPPLTEVGGMIWRDRGQLVD